MKLIDFGLCGYYVAGKRLRCHCGSPSYAAPEIVVRARYVRLARRLRGCCEVGWRCLLPARARRPPTHSQPHHPSPPPPPSYPHPSTPTDQQARKDYLGPPVDVWSLGIVLFAALAGYLPFHAKDKKALSEKILAGGWVGCGLSCGCPQSLRVCRRGTCSKTCPATNLPPARPAPPAQACTSQRRG